MRGHLLAVVSAALFSCLAAGCGEMRDLVQSEDVGTELLDLLGLLDDSGSFQHRQEAAEKVLVPAVQSAKGGDRCIVRAIAEESMTLGDLVNETVPSTDRPFDVETARKQDEVRDRMAQTILSFATRDGKSQRTDIIGAIASIATVPKREGARRVLLIASDLLDTGRGPAGLRDVDLSDVHVIVVYCEMDEPLSEYQRRTEQWRQAFVSAGAASVAIHSPSASRALDIGELLGRK